MERTHYEKELEDNQEVGPNLRSQRLFWTICKWLKRIFVPDRNLDNLAVDDTSSFSPVVDEEVDCADEE